MILIDSCLFLNVFGLKNLHRLLFFFVILQGKIAIGQAIYDNCSTALELCPNVPVSLSTSACTRTLCAGCEDDLNTCFSAQNSCWLKFTTNTTGGTIQLNFTGLSFQNASGTGTSISASILAAGIPCVASTYTYIGNCQSGQSSSFNITATSLSPLTTYYVVVSGDVGQGNTLPAKCDFTTTISGSGINRPTPSVYVNANTPVCKQDTIRATAVASNCPDNSTYRWYVNGIYKATTADSIFLYSGIENGDIIQVETDCYLQCAQTALGNSSTITVTDVFIDAGPPIQIMQGQAGVLEAATTADSFYWSPAMWIDSNTTLSPGVFPPETMLYTLHAFSNGCWLEDYVLVTVMSELVFPSTFSPNEDGINDYWELPGIDIFPDAFVQIFNRWGQLVYQSAGYSEEKYWDGTDNGKPLNEGVYFYVVSLRDSQKREYKGTVSIVR